MSLAPLPRPGPNLSVNAPKPLPYARTISTLPLYPGSDKFSTFSVHFMVQYKMPSADFGPYPRRFFLRSV